MNNITIELCAEDRARLDRLTAAMEKLAAETSCEIVPIDLTIPPEVAEAAPKAPQKPQEAPKAEPEHTDTPKAETAAEAPTAQEAAKQEPTVNMDQIRQLTIQLAAAGGDIKRKAFDVITTYGTKVSDLESQPDKWDEVWAKLNAIKDILTDKQEG